MSLPRRLPGRKLDTLGAFVALVRAAEDSYPYVSLERLRRLARREPRWKHLSANLARLVEQTMASGLLLCDNRHRLSRTGAVQPIRIYRLNRRRLATSAVEAGRFARG
jgi:hypothetical protein